VTELRIEDILELDRYEPVRDEYRARILEHKKERRVGLGDKVTMLFEDRETVRYQIQEMARVERIRDPEKLQHEIDTYGELIPRRGELSATLFIEIAELSQVKPELDRLVGIDECVAIVIDDGEEEELVRGRFDARQLEEDRISAVHYVRFSLTAGQRRRFATAERLRVRIDHVNYRAEAEIGPRTRKSLLRDLSGESPVLLFPSGASPPRAPEILAETARARAYRPARPMAAEHVVVEPLDGSVSLLSADPELLAELMGLVQRFARAMTERVGGCRVAARTVQEGGETRNGLRWHLLGGPG
jgi:diadenosine tetraphosphate (Ap4A) HIT family hydrolase